MDTVLNLQAVKKTKYGKHTSICSGMQADTHALNREKKAEERAAVKVAKKASKLALKGKKDTPEDLEEILLSEHAEEAENITVTINEEPVGESFGNFLDGKVVEMREIESQHVKNVTAEKPEKTTATSTSEDMWTDSDDIAYDSDDIQCLSDLESDDDSPVKVKITKAFIEKINENKRKLNLSVEIIMDSKKRKLSFE
jgi:hypothetical protein